VAAADRRTAEDAFMAGILHDLGKHLLPTLWPDEAAAIELAARTEGRPVHAIESERLGTTHAELGAHLLAAWGLPYPVIEAVANHHQPRRVRQPQGMNVLAAVHVANALANELTRAAGDGDLPFTPIDDHYLRELGLHDQLPEWRGLATACLGATRSAQWIDRPGAQAA
jgi:HD-like signal output (HDOD) protein